MGNVKWIKLTVNVFDDEKFDAIRTLPDSNDIQLIWIKLLCLAGKCNENGFLMLTNEIPYTEEMLAQHFRMDIGIVQRAIKLFVKLGMIDVENNVYMVSNWLKYQSGDDLAKIKDQNRKRQAEYKKRQRALALESKSNVTGNVTGNVRSNVNCSYSYSLSNNNNIENLNYILGNELYKDNDFLKENIELLNSIREWMEYKDNKKPKSQNHYDTEMGIKKLLSQIVSHAKEYGIEATVETINASIANNYQGIVWSQLERRKPNQSKAADTSVIDNWGRT